ncbi:hypothetical protein MTR_0607s0040, partial [Medicago truncatula]
MGVKGLKAFNMDMVGKKTWKLVSSLESLITHLLKAKYFPRSDYFGASIGHNPSYVWRSIWRAKDWNMELINTFFETVTARNIFNTLFLPSATHDMPVSKFETDGTYSVKSAYKDILNHDVAIVQHRVLRKWNCIWSLRLPESEEFPLASLLFSTNVFAILQHLDQQQKQIFSVTLWSIWKHRNNKVENNITETAQAIYARA